MFMVEVGTHVRMGFNKVHEVAKRNKRAILEICNLWVGSLWIGNLGEQNGFT